MSRKSKDVHAQAGHIRGLVEIKVMAHLPLESYSSFGAQSAEELNTPQSKTKQNTYCALLLGSLSSEFKILLFIGSGYVLQMKLLGPGSHQEGQSCRLWVRAEHTYLNPNPEMAE